jgi:MFS transporter, DHA1 family, inner membrane transport protein
MNSLKPSLAERAASFFGLGLGLIALVFITRLVVDTSFRMLYPFIPQMSSGLKVSITVFSWLLTIRSITGLLGPVIGTLADRYGRRKVMAMGLISQTLGMIGMAFATGWWSVLPMILTGIAVNSFVPAQQAYISDLAPFERRGRALASVDIAFAIAGIFMMPLVGWMIEAWGWRVPFLILSGLSVLAALVIWIRLPSAGERSPAQMPLGIWPVFRRRNVMAAVIVSMTYFVAVGIFMTFWSVWLSADYAFDAVALGLVATSIGVAELSGAILSGLFIDRIGKRRGSLIGIALATVVFLLIPLTAGNITWIRVILVIAGVLVEFGIVSLFPLYGEQAPEARATVFSLVALGNGIGLGLGPPLTVALWHWQGLGAVMVVGALSLGLSFVGVWGFLRDRPEQVRSG